MTMITKRIVSYSRFVKIEHTLFALPLLYSGALLARQGFPNWRLSLLILGAATGARTVAFSLNRIIDRHSDAQNPRTRYRELPSGAMSLKEAWAICIAGLIFFIAFAGLISPLCVWLSPIPILVFAAYPYLKRYTPLAHFGVGLADAFAPLGGWMAVQKSFLHSGAPLLLAAFTILWVSGFDIIYSTLDEEFDRQAGLHSLPSALGSETALKISAVLHGAAFLLLMGLYSAFLTSSVFGLALLLVIGVLFFWEQAHAKRVEMAFFHVNAVLGFLILAFIAVGVR